MKRLLYKLKYLKSLLIKGFGLNTIYYINSPQTLPPPLSKEDEERLTEFISHLSVKNPRDMAQKILQYSINLCKGNIQDDMSVLVFGMWKN